ncbi:MAG: MBL fold metallo-hydrolase [Bacillota bacterium]
MKIFTLVEDNQKDINLESEHGVSFYIETNKHKLLFDVGQTELFLSNAKKLGINLTDVDTVVISHGHYDHGGGLEHFLKINNHAKIYIQKSAFDEFFSMRKNDEYTYIGLNKDLNQSRFILLEGDLIIDEELIILNKIEEDNYFPTSNQTLYKKVNNKMMLDDFNHEQNLLINYNHKHFLFAGCAHKGIVNIINQAKNKIHNKNLHMVLGGFHLKSRYEQFEESEENIKKIANQLDNKKINKYYTGHCTGNKAFTIMKEILKDKLFSFYPGLKIEI